MKGKLHENPNCAYCTVNLYRLFLKIVITHLNIGILLEELEIDSTFNTEFLIHMSPGLTMLNKSQHREQPCPEIIRAVWDSGTCLRWIHNQGGIQCTDQYGQGSLHLLRKPGLGQ